jgi:putative oxidoreductase
MSYELTLLVGRLLFGGYFAFSGLNHFMKPEQLSGWVESKGFPAPDILVYVSGMMLLLGGIGIAIGAYPVVSILLVGVFLAAVTPTFHDFWSLEGEERQSHMTNFLKNIALIGALLMSLSLNWSVYAAGMGLGFL